MCPSIGFPGHQGSLRLFLFIFFLQNATSDNPLIETIHCLSVLLQHFVRLEIHVCAKNGQRQYCFLMLKIAYVSSLACPFSLFSCMSTSAFSHEICHAVHQPEPSLISSQIKVLRLFYVRGSRFSLASRATFIAQVIFIYPVFVLLCPKSLEDQISSEYSGTVV